MTKISISIPYISPKERICEGKANIVNCSCAYVCLLCQSLSYLSLIELDQSWPGSMAAVIQDQLSKDG